MIKTFSLARWAHLTSAFGHLDGFPMYLHPETEIFGLVVDPGGFTEIWAASGGERVTMMVKESPEQIEAEMNRAWEQIRHDMMEAKVQLEASIMEHKLGAYSLTDTVKKETN